MFGSRPVLSIVTAATEAPISLAEAKARLNVDHDDDDARLTGIIAACVANMDGPTGRLGRCIVSQIWEQRFSGFCNPLALALSPVISVVSVKYFDRDGVEQTVDPADFELVPRGDRRALLHAFASWPAVDGRRALPVTVRTTCGFGANANGVPAPIREALFLHVGALYERRDALDFTAALPTPLGFDGLVEPYALPTT